MLVSKVKARRKRQSGMSCEQAISSQQRVNLSQLVPEDVSMLPVNAPATIAGGNEELGICRDIYALSAQISI